MNEDPRTIYNTSNIEPLYEALYPIYPQQLYQHTSNTVSPKNTFEAYTTI